MSTGRALFTVKRRIGRPVSGQAAGCGNPFDFRFQQKIDFIKMVAGFVNLQPAGEFFVTVPAPVIAAAVKKIEFFVVENSLDLANCPGFHQFNRLAETGVIA